MVGNVAAIPEPSTPAMGLLGRRGINIAALEAVPADPEQTVAVRPGRTVYQSRIESGRRILRVFVDIDRHPAVVVTAYRTSNFRKYWQPHS